MSKKNKKEFLFSMLENQAHDNNISVLEMCKHLQNAFIEVYNRMIDGSADLKFIIDEKKRIFEIKKKLKVVEVVDKDEKGNDKVGKDKIFPYTEISLKDAKKINKKVVVNEEAYFPLSLNNFTQNFTIQLQNKLKEFLDKDKNILLEKKYKQKIGELISGEVTLIKKGNISVDVGDCVAIIEPCHQIPREMLRPTDKIYALIEAAELTSTKFTLKLSRNTEEFIKKLFELEIDEVADDLVRIRKIVRIPGVQTVVVVSSDEQDIKAALACIGQGAARIKAIRNWVNKELITVVEYSPNVETQFKNLFGPDIIDSVHYNGSTRVMNVWINDWDNKIALFYGPRKANLWNALKLCNLFDIRPFDPNQTSREEILGLKEPMKKVVTPVPFEAKEKVETLDTQSEFPKEEQDSEVIVNNKESKVSEIVGDEVELDATAYQSKEVEQPKPKASVNIDGKNKVEIITVKSKKEQKSSKEDFLKRQREKLNLKASDFDIDEDEEYEEDKYDDFDYDSFYEDE